MIFLIPGCFNPPASLNDEFKLPPIIKTAGELFDINLQIPCHAHSVKGIKIDSINKAVAYRTSFYENKDSITIFMNKNSKILNAADGVVTFLDNEYKQHNSYVVEVTHKNLLKTRYVGIRKPLVKEGQKISASRPLGLCEQKFDFAIYVRKDLITKSDINKFYKLIFREYEWMDIFSAVLIFGKEVFNEKTN